MVTIFPKTHSLADTPGATNYVDPSGYPSSWPSSWTVYTVDGQSLEDQTNGGGDDTKGAAPANEGDVAPCGGESVFVERDSNNIYFRICLNDNPSGNNTDPFTSNGSWSFLIDVDGDGYREFVITLDGKQSQNFDDAPDNLYVLYKNDQRQDFFDSDLQLGNGGSATVGNSVLWVQDSAQGDPVTAVDGESNWEASEIGGIRDFKRTRVVNRGDGTYYLDVQVPLAALDATDPLIGGSKIDASTPIALAFATANSNTDPSQKDIAYPGNFTPQPDQELPFGDVVTEDGIQDEPVINSVTGSSCGASSSISAEVIDSLVLESGSLVSSIGQVEFFYYADLNGNNIADDSQSWVFIGNGSLATDTINPWNITWDTTSLDTGQYLLKAVATDNQNNIVDSAETDSSDENYNAGTNGTMPIIGTLDNNDCGIIPDSDYGDAPVDYDDTADNNDLIDENDNPASHIIVSSLYLGSIAPDNETKPQSSTDADLDDIVADPAVDDEDGINSFPLLNTNNSSYSLITTVNNTSGRAANVYAWIDFDLDGEFDEDERATITNGNITLNDDGKVPTGSSGTVTLNWSNIGVTGANITAGNSYLRIRISTDDLDQTSETTHRDDASVGAANDGEVEDYPIAIASSSSISEQPYCESIGGTLSTANLFTEADNGTFGNGTAKNQISPLSPSDLTTYSYSYRYPPNDNTYVVSTHSDINGFGTWHNPFGHTTGSETDRFLVINANRDIVGTEMVQSGIISGLFPHTNYTFTAYILNLVGRNPNHIDPNVAYGIDLIGVDDDDDGIVDEAQEIEIRFSTGDLEEQLIDDLGGSEPLWEQFAFLFNTGNATSARFIIRNNKLGGFGNDLAIDDITLEGCNLPSGNLAGTLYYDNNKNDIFDSQEPGLPSGSTIRLIDTKGTTDINDDVLVTRMVNSGGKYNFLNIPVSSNYQVLAPDEDGLGNSIGTTNPRTGISVTAGSTTSSQDFGYDTQTSLLLVKRITAINGTTFNEFVNDLNDNNDDDVNWPSDKDTYLRGKIDVENIQPGDEVEYSIYFLSNGRKSVKNLKICDVVPDHMTFVKNSYGTEVGISLGLDEVNLPATLYHNLSNVIGDDQGDFYDSGTNPPDKLCQKIDPTDSSKLIEVDASNNINGFDSVP